MSTPHVSPARPAVPVVERTCEGLLGALDAIDVEGWEGPSATALLTYIRTAMVRPLAVDVGLRGAAASQAEASAWEAVWLQMCEPSLRQARSPWGVLWQTARRALLAEVLAARWATSPGRAWRHDRDERAGVLAHPVSLDALLNPDAALEPPGEPPRRRPLRTTVAQAINAATDALVAAGWDDALAQRIVEEVAALEIPLGSGATVLGWRRLAEQLGLVPWQARRLTFVLRGTTERPGLLARILHHGLKALDDPRLTADLRSTVDHRAPTPSRGLRRPQTGSPQRAAS